MRNVLWMMAATLLGENALEAQDALVNRFMREAPAKWSEYGAFTDRLQGKENFKRIRNEQVQLLYSGIIKQNHVGKLCLRQFEVNGGDPRQSKDWTKGYVWATNTKYSFSLERKTDAAPWTLTHVAPRQEPDRSEAFANATKSTQQLRSLMSIRGEELPALVQHRSFRVLQAARVAHEGVEAVRIVFDNAHSFQEAYSVIQSGTLTLDPNNAWVLRECDVLCKYRDGSTAKVHVATRYRPEGKYPMPVRIVEEAENRDAGGKFVSRLVTETTLDVEEPARFPEDLEFTLTAFGLPEPPGVEWERPVPLWVWVAGGGLACLVSGVSLYWLKRRSAARAAGAKGVHA